jgi:siroheme synthase
MVNDSIKAKGTLQLTLIDENGNIKQQDEHNLVVNTGLAYIASRIKDATATTMTHMAVGTGSTAAAAADTALGTPLGARVGLDSTTLVTTNATNDSVQYVATFAAGVSTGAITEAGIFNALTSGTMLCRTVFAVINKGSLDTLVITWKVTVA